MSISSYNMATSPSDRDNKNILEWLDRLQASVRTAGEGGGAQAFRLDARGTGAGAGTRVSGGAGALEESDESEGEGARGADYEDAESVPADDTTVHDDAVPLGLIANLSLKNNRGKGRSASSTDDNGDDDVVRACLIFLF